VSWRYRRSGQAERVEQRHGPVSRVDEAAKRCLLDALEARPDLTLAEAKQLIESWRREYNENRPHRALGDRTPSEFIAQFATSCEPSAT